MSQAIGGQAGLEGGMMRSPSPWALALRQPDGEIAELNRTINSPMARHRVFRLPVIRGVIALGESLAIGFRALAISANYASQQTDEEGEVQTELSRGAILFAFAIAIGFAIALFKVTPALITSWLPIETTGWFVVVEGVIRVAIFIAYISLISLLPDLRRVFQFHGAEHKAINAYEAGAPLTVESVREFTLIHPRCGTSFLLVVLLINFVVSFLFVREWPLWARVVSHIPLIPLIAAVSYELLRLSAANYHRRWVRMLVGPSLAFQKLTTREPSDEMVATAIAALLPVLAADGAAVPEHDTALAGGVLGAQPLVDAPQLLA